jgi:hypothetical protein
MLLPETASLAASMVKDSLEENGQITKRIVVNIDGLMASSGATLTLLQVSAALYGEPRTVQFSNEDFQNLFAPYTNNGAKDIAADESIPSVWFRSDSDMGHHVYPVTNMLTSETNGRYEIEQCGFMVETIMGGALYKATVVIYKDGENVNVWCTGSKVTDISTTTAEA